MEGILQRVRNNTAALFVGVLLLLGILHLPASAGDPFPDFDEFQSPEIAIAGASGMREAPDGTLWIIDNSHLQLIKWDRGCSQQPDDNCAEYFPIVGEDTNYYGFTLAFYDDPLVDSSPDTYQVYMTRPNVGQVSVFDQDGNLQFTFGQIGTADGEFQQPSGIAVDSDGNIYVSDTLNDRIQVFDPAGAFVEQWFVSFNLPRGMIYEPTEDKLYVVVGDLYYVYLYRVSTTGLIDQTWIMADQPYAHGDITKLGNNVYMIDSLGTGSIHALDISLETTYDVYSGNLFLPSGLAVVDALTPDAELLVADASNRIHRFTAFLLNGGLFEPEPAGTFGTRGSDPGYFSYANGIAIGADGTRYVVDGYNHRIQLFDSAGNFLSQWIHPWNTPGLPGDLDGADGPNGIAIGDDGAVYVADPDARGIIYFPPNYDGGVSGPVFWDFGAVDQYLNRPGDVALDPEGRIFVTDRNAGAVRVYQKDVPVPTSADDFSYLGGFSVAGGESSPHGIAIRNGKVYVADPGGTDEIHIFDFSGSFPPTHLGTILGFGNTNGLVSGISDIIFDNEGQLWVADSGNHRIQVFEVVVGDTIVANFINAIGTLGGDEGQFFYPSGIAHDGDNKLFVADTLNHRYQVFTGTPTDSDEDGVPDSEDNCVNDANAGQENSDDDLNGDACDGDDDNDEVPDASDNCPTVSNLGQLDTDSDDIGNACDTDDDNDGENDVDDNCPLDSNSDQLDTDSDDIGNACDTDDDGDNVDDEIDNCPLAANPGQEDANENDIGDACDDTPTASPTATPTGTLQPLSTPTATGTAAPTRTPTAVPPTADPGFNPPTQVPSSTPIATITPVPTGTALATGTPASTQTPAATSTAAPGTTPNAAPANTGSAAQIVTTETPAPSPTAVSTTVPASTPTPTVTPTPGAAGVVATPGGGSGPGLEDRPELFSEVLDARDITVDIEALTANAVLSLILLLLLIDASIFNSTIKENEHVIMGFFGGVAAPLKAVGNAWTERDSQSFISRFGKPLLVLGVSAFVYSLLEPDFKFDQSALILFLSLLLGIGIATYVYEGTQVLISERFFSLNGAIRFYPIAILIAIVSVTFSKLTGLQPGLVYGFVAAAALLSAREPTRKEEGMIVFFPMLAMLGVSLLAWLSLGPIRGMSEDGGWIPLILEGAALSLFLGGIQGLLFSLIPLPFMDGEKIWNWNKLAWIAIVFPVGFLFFHVVINQDGTLQSAVSEHGVTALIILAAVSWTLTIATWLVFKWRGTSAA